MKLTAFALSTILLTGLLSGCGNTSQETTNQEAGKNVPAIIFEQTEENNRPELVMNQQPQSSYWFPEELLAWTPELDPDLEFNKSVIPLAPRVERNNLSTINNSQNKDTNIMAISIMNSSTSGNAPNGLNSADCNTFSYWQYIDTLVYWGGSSGEGLIVPPSPDVTDAGHKNGVKVIGTIFFPQNAHGGKLEWLDTFLQKDASGSFPIINQLITVANTYGFDGWFLNQETEGTETQPLTKEHAALTLEFISAFKAAAPELELIYYDSMTLDGEMDWQNALTDKNISYVAKNENGAMADSMFLNFWWTMDKFAPQELLKTSRDKALEHNLDPYDLYAGIDIQNDGYLTPIQWDLFESGTNSTYTSLGVYCPNWAYTSSSDMEDFWKKENAIWVNSSGNPSAPKTTSEEQFRGISTYAVERSAITSLPFITHFNTGNGYQFFKKGEVLSKMDWNNRSLSDLLPTYRYVINQFGNNALKATLDVATAYYGGNSLKLYGSIEAQNSLDLLLYSMDLPITEQTTFTTIAKADLATQLDAVIDFDDGTSKVISPNSKVGTEWTTLTYDLSDFVGKNMRRLSYRIITEESASQYALNFGSIAITENQTPQLSTITDLKVTETEFDEDAMYAGVRLSWSSDIPSSYYEIYRINENKSRSLLGVSNKTNFYVNTLPRTDKTNTSTFAVVPVTQLLETGTESTITMDWPNNSLPKAEFRSDVTLIAPGDTVQFESKCSENTQNIEWTFEGASSTDSTEENPSITYPAAGSYKVTLKAVNEAGEAETAKEHYIVVSDRAANGLSLLSQKKDTIASSYVNENEASAFAVDGDVSKKWCATGSAPHELTIDLGSAQTISSVDISHAEAGGEGSDMNTKAYTISVSTDGTQFEPVLNQTRNTAGTTHDTFAPVTAQYVKLSILKPTQGSDSAARIYEVEVYGLPDELITDK